MKLLAIECPVYCDLYWFAVKCYSNIQSTMLKVNRNQNQYVAQITSISKSYHTSAIMNVL